MNLNKNKLVTKLPEAKVFRHLRIKSGMKTRELAALMGCTNALVSHFESGRNPLPKHRKEQLCKIFRITLSDLEDYTSGKVTIPINYKDECFLLLSKMENEKLQSVYGILSSLSA